MQDQFYYAPDGTVVYYFNDTGGVTNYYYFTANGNQVSYYYDIYDNVYYYYVDVNGQVVTHDVYGRILDVAPAYIEPQTPVVSAAQQPGEKRRVWPWVLLIIGAVFLLFTGDSVFRGGFMAVRGIADFIGDAASGSLELSSGAFTAITILLIAGIMWLVLGTVVFFVSWAFGAPLWLRFVLAFFAVIGVIWIFYRFIRRNVQAVSHMANLFE